MASDPADPRTLEQAVGEMTVLWNHCQALVFSLFFHSLGVELPKAQSVFFSIRSDAGQRVAAQRLLESSPSDFATRAVDTIEDLAKLSGARNAFIHAIWDFPEGSAVANNWLAVWRKQLGDRDPIQTCDGLIAKLQIIHRDLTQLEEERRSMRSAAQGTLALALPAMPARQGAVQAASLAGPALQQPAAQLDRQQQPPSAQRNEDRHG